MKHLPTCIAPLAVLTVISLNAAPAAAAPDLVLTNFYAAVSSNTVSFYTTICNQGDATSKSFSLELFYNRIYAPTCTTAHNDKRTIQGMASGTCTTHAFARYNTPPGLFTAWIAVDANCVVGESSESNNKASYGYSVQQPDLVLTDLSAAVAGKTVTFEATVCNMSNIPATKFDLELYYHLTSAPGCNTAHSQKVTISSLAAGACTLRTFTRTNTPNGNYTVWARADANCVIGETNENNNNYSN